MAQRIQVRSGGGRAAVLGAASTQVLHLTLEGGQQTLSNLAAYVTEIVCD
jgi:hypothetical protein